MSQIAATASRDLRPLPQLIFGSRWLQLPLYLGLIVDTLLLPRRAGSVLDVRLGAQAWPNCSHPARRPE
jgi:hypothetical protein